MAQAANAETARLREQAKQEAAARQQAAWDARDAELAAARQHQADQEMAALNAFQEFEKQHMEAGHAHEMAIREAEARRDQAEHMHDLNRI